MERVRVVQVSDTIASFKHHQAPLERVRAMISALEAPTVTTLLVNVYAQVQIHFK